MQTLLPVLLAVHIAFALGLFLPSLLLPFALRARRSAEESASPLVQALLWLQSRGGIVVGLGLVATGVALVGVLGIQLLNQPWLLVALAIYAANLAIAVFVQRPNLRRLVGVRATSDDRLWTERARRQRYVSYAMAGLVGTIGVLMSAKPQLW
jgi:divalent metal cation (Fe/Co/Zn/Cd) transporter